MSCSSCGRDKVHAKGLCGSCYSRWLKSGDPTKTKVKKEAECAYCGEFGWIKGHGFCPACFGRYIKNGSPERIKIKKRQPCGFCGIEKEIHAHGLCSSCYDRRRSNGTPEYQRVRHICKVEGCDDVVKSDSLCAKHYQRWLRHGHTDQTRPINYGKIGKHPLREQWRWMSKRAHNAHVLVSQEWRDDFEAFVRDVGPKPSPDHILQLMDSKGIYEKGNVAWIKKVTKKERNETQKEYLNRWAREDRINHPLKHKDRSLRKQFGIGLEEYQKKVEEQNGKCSICGEEESNYNKNGHKISLSVDHCHKTGTIRSLLCKKCNTGLGSFKDSQELLLKAIEYLKKYEK